MDAFDFKEPSEPRNIAEIVWNILTVVVLLGVVCVLVYTVTMILDSDGGIRILSLTTPTSMIPTSTATSRITLPPTWTPGPTATPTPTETPPPSQTPFPMVTPEGAATPSASGMGYIPQGEPQMIQDFQNLGCSWMGIGGNVVDLRSSPVTGLLIQVGGTLGGQLFETQTMITGLARQYGESGYEFKLADKPIASNNTLWIQLIDQASLPLSEKIYFQTSDDCKKNLIIISFKQVK
ncbi:MAG: hypothetical protein ACOYYS_08360 [Chloroflexota bacterium]